jgi:hypothetical protein
MFKELFMESNSIAKDLKKYLSKNGYKIQKEDKDYIQFYLQSKGEPGAEMELEKIFQNIGKNSSDYVDEIQPYKAGKYLARVYLTPID